MVLPSSMTQLLDASTSHPILPSDITVAAHGPCTGAQVVALLSCRQRTTMWRGTQFSHTARNSIITGTQ
eukprot:2223150-Pyramimonas_sp.AAC.1